MNVEITLPEVIEISKEIQAVPEKLLEIMRLDICNIVADCLRALIPSKLSAHSGRGQYELSMLHSISVTGFTLVNMSLNGCGRLA